MIQFIELLTIPSGPGAGEQIRLRDWQKAFIHDVYGGVDARDRRAVRRAILSIARKNGKTALAAALVLIHLCGPEAVENGEIFSAATDKEQAAQVFKYCRQFIEAEPHLQAMVEVVPSTKRILCPRNGSFYAALSRESGTKHGLNPSFVVFDELAQARNRELFDVLDTAMGARAEPLFMTISTQNNDPSHILSQMIDDGLSGRDPTTVCHLYAAEEDADVLDEAGWAAANPGLGDFLDQDWFQGQAARAAESPGFESSFRNLHLNQRVTTTAPLISKRLWSGCEGVPEIAPGERVFAGLDLSSRLDLTALAWVSEAEPPRIGAAFFKPERALGEHSARDFGAGSRQYQDWALAGLLTATAGATVDYAAIAHFLADSLMGRFEIAALAYDRWRIDDFIRELDRADIAAQKGEGDGLRLEPWGQGFRDMSPAVEALEVAALNADLVHPGHPILTWNIANAVVSTDAAGNRKFDKEMSRLRIDGAVALAMAMGVRARFLEPKQENPYETRGLRSLEMSG